MLSKGHQKNSLAIIYENFGFDRDYSKNEIYRKFQEIGLVGNNFFSKFKSWRYLIKIHNDDYSYRNNSNRHFGKFCKVKHKK